MRKDTSRSTKKCKSALQTEQDYLMQRKKETNLKWDTLIDTLKKGDKVSHFVIYQTMDECNRVDWRLLRMGLLHE